MAKGAVDGTPLRVTRDAVIRFLLGAQHLAHDGPRGLGPAPTPAAVLREIRHLECVQIDPVSVVERNQHLVLAARLPGYLPRTLGELLRRRRVFEYWANASCIIPVEDYPIFEGTRRRYRKRLAPDLTALRPVVRRIFADIDAHGPLAARAFVSDHRVRGAWDLGDPKTKATSHALSLLLKTGDLLVVKREGLERYFDLPERTVPAALMRRARAISAYDADELLLEKYLRAYRLFDAGDPRFGWRAMPILFGDRLVGRLDPHLDREERRLVIRLLHLEPQVRPTGRLRRALRAALESFARFHGAADLKIGRAVPAGLRL